jgi:dolichol-phosphate mannosyltransferase
MLNLQDNNIHRNNQILGSCTLSIILPTQHGTPIYLSPEEIREIIPKEISTEIIVVQYNSKTIAAATNLHSKEEYERNKVHKTTSNDDQSTTDFRVEGGFVSAILKGIEFSAGQFILVMDANFPYPKEIIAEIISELIKYPNSIIVVSRYTKGASMQKLPVVRRLISKGARTVARHGLNISDVQDPLSGCFALPKEVVKNIEIDGKGNQILLEILVKIRSKNSNNVVVTEIPFQQKIVYSVKKLEFILILDYFHALWNLYCHSRNSKKVQGDRVTKEQLKHRSIPFLSKTARFFTVGASGLALNYIVSFLLSNVVSNLWYIQATVFGIVLSITTNFLLNKVWTFEDKDFCIRHVSRQYLSFFTLCTFGAIIQLTLVFAFVEYSHIQYVSALILAVCIASLGNFLLNKKITFGERIWE